MIRHQSNPNNLILIFESLLSFHHLYLHFTKVLFFQPGFHFCRVGLPGEDRIGFGFLRTLNHLFLILMLPGHTGESHH